MLNGSDHYQAFKDRIKESLTKPVDSQLSQLLSAADHSALLEFIETVPMLEELKAGDSKRFNKAAHHLPRTLSVVRDHFGVFKLFVETKSKTASGAKHLLPLIEGGFKKGKPAWKIDGGAQEYMSLVSYQNRGQPDKKILEKSAQEVLIQNQYAAAYIAPIDLGSSYYNKDTYKVSMYSPMALGTLEDIITKKESFVTKELRSQFAHEMLYAVNELHKAGIIHQDLKIENILVYPEGNGGYCLKITDFGLCIHEKYTHLRPLAGSPIFFSPEALSSHHIANTDLWNYILLMRGEGSFAFELFSWKTFRYPHPPEKGLYRIPDKANDMWVMGINLYYLMHGQFPTLAHWDTIQSCPLLKGLLAYTRDQRLNAEDALKVYYLIENKKLLLSEAPKEEFLESYNYLQSHLPHLHGTYYDTLSSDEKKALALILTPKEEAPLLAETPKKRFKAERQAEEDAPIDTNIQKQVLTLFKAHRQSTDLAPAPLSPDSMLATEHEPMVDIQQRRHK